MADNKLTDLTVLNATPATGDKLYIVDVSDTTDSPQGTSKQITIANALSSPGGRSYAAQTISSSGDSTPTLSTGLHTQNITLSGASSGDGARVSLSIADRVAGDKVFLHVSFAADASHLRIYNVNTSGTLLLDQTNDSTARKFHAEFTYTGTAWILTGGDYYA